VPPPTRLLVVDDDAASRNVLARALDDAGFAVDTVASGGAALAWLARHTPSLVLLDLLMPPPDGYTVLRAMHADTRTRDIPVVVITSIDSDEDVVRAFEMGADDCIRKPFRSVELIARIRSQLRLRGYVEALGQKERDASVVLELTQALCSTLDFRSILFTVVRRIVEVTRVTRCSIAIVRQRSDVGYVIAQSDNRGLGDLRLDLTQFPEIRTVMETRTPLVIEGPVTRPFLDLVPTELPESALRTIALFPIVFEEKAMGVLFLHGFPEPFAPREHELSLARTVASAVAIALRNARIFQSVRDENEQITFARAEAERRLTALQRYADFFQAAADGIVVVDDCGKVLFSNPRAHAILGRTEEELAKGTLGDLIDPKNPEPIAEISRAFREGRALRTLDLTLRGEPESAPRVLSVNCSSVLLDESDALLVSFRDVTLDRATAAELIKTKEFLERVIDASASAIISTDMSGTVLLWSRAAERISGYTAKEVVGRKNIRDFYPPGQSTRIRRLLHSHGSGGHGRLEGYRTNVIARDGSYVPVRLSAALIMERNFPVGSVSLLTDLRDTLRVEVRVTEAEEELRAREKEALIHELAGAAAHELNQPLTSVLGYAALIRKRTDDHPAVHSATCVIIHEAERMAAIVRKIGKITRYETKSYVGTARILDLDRSSEEEPEPH
jgi:PAS domain S-box-containing protein